MNFPQLCQCDIYFHISQIQIFRKNFRSQKKKKKCGINVNISYNIRRA